MNVSYHLLKPHWKTCQIQDKQHKAGQAVISHLYKHHLFLLEAENLPEASGHSRTSFSAYLDICFTPAFDVSVHKQQCCRASRGSSLRGALQHFGRESSQPPELVRDQSALCFNEAEMTRDTIQTIPRWEAWGFQEDNNRVKKRKYWGQTYFGWVWGSPLCGICSFSL